MKYHDNEVYIVNPSGYKLCKNGSSYGTFEIKESYVTKGQDPDGCLKAGKVCNVASDGKIVFRAGRSKSADTANWWKKRIADNRNTFGKSPDELNFAMIGTLTLFMTGGIFGNEKVRLVLKDIAMAQGNTASRNNWWFGGYECYHDENDRVLCFGELDDGNAVRITVDRSELGSSVNTYSFYYGELILTGNAEWMKSQKDSKKLREFVLPASHDAGMSKLHHVDVASVWNEEAIQTQDASIYEQLLYGCRYFDIRVDYEHNELVTYHRTSYFGANGQSLEDVFDQALYFCKKYPSETAILKISHIRDGGGHNPSDTIKKLVPFLESYKDMLYTSTEDVKLHELTLKDLRKKILLVCDFDGIDTIADAQKGIFKYHDAGAGAEQICVNQMNVYDKYSDSSHYNKMASDQTDKWKNNADDKENKLFLLSWTLTPSFIETAAGVVVDGAGSVRVLASEANGHLEDVLKEKIKSEKYPLPNMVYMDFINYEVCNIVIPYND